MAGSDYKLKIVIDADGTTAKQALEGLKADFNGLGGRITSTFGGMVPLVNAGATAIAGIGVAAAAVGATLFQITKTAAEFGSTIYDASQKTGLGATAISSLKAAADQSGSSLEAVTKGIAKFAKQYEGTSADLEAELGKVFKQIANAKPGFEQLTLAQQKFGKSGADLIPMIMSFDGDLGGLIKRMEELGITIDDEAAAAADAFGDQMDVLGAQMAGVGRTIGTALMPQFTRIANSISDWLIQNKDNVSTFATVTANAFSTFVRGLESVTGWVNRNQKTLGIIFNLTTGGAWGLAMSGINSEYNRLVGMGGSSSGEASGMAGRPAGSYDPDSMSGGKSAKAIFKPSSQAQAIIDAAKKLGISPLDLATIIGFETAGTYSPEIKNSRGYMGLIQFGAAEQKQYGVSAGQSFENQVTTSVVAFLRDRFAQAGRSTAGASLLDLYRTVLGGNPNASLTKTDANGTSPLSGVQQMLRDHRPQALSRFFGGNEANAKGGDWGREYGGFASAAEKDAAAAKQAEADFFDYADQVLQDWINAEKLASSERLEIRAEENNLAEEMLHDQLNKGLISETEYIDRIATLKINALEDEREELAAQIATRETNHKIAKLELKIAAEKLKKENDIADALERQNEEYREMIGALKKANQRPYGMKTRTANDGGFFGDMFGGMDEATGKIRNFQDIIRGFGQAASDVFMQIGQGLGATLQSWVLLGDQAEVSMSKMVATILAGVAAQAATLAIFHLAMGLVALTPWGAAMYGPATNHFIAAAIWGGIAAGAAVGGRAFAGNKFQSGSGKGSTTSSNRSSDSESLTPYSRASERAYHSGTQQDPVRRLATAVERLDKKIGSMKPGDVLTAGARQKPGFFASQTGNDIARNSSLGSRILRNAGVR